jgi:hypothetical protein
LKPRLKIKTIFDVILLIFTKECKTLNTAARKRPDSTVLQEKAISLPQNQLHFLI